MTDKKEGQYLQALVWYRKEHWQELRDLFTDTNRLPTTFEQWEKMAEENLAKIKAEGDIPVKVFVEPDKFMQWCTMKKMQPDAEARTTFAIEVVTIQRFGEK